jgi:polysaccharide biosynthesis/export protein
MNIKLKIRLASSICILLFANQSFSQVAGNPDFISSLPENIRGDFLKELSMTYKNEPDKVFKAPDSAVYKMGGQLEDLKLQIQKLEMQYQSNTSPNTLKPFGSNFFNTYQSTFMPINEPNFAADYILDAGDTLKIQLVGQKNDLFSSVVRRDGSVMVPELGMINVGGLSLNAASDIIKLKAKTSFIGTEGFVSLTNMRDINVLVTGNVFAPGMYTVSGGANILSVLNIVGGINSNGSYRNISIKRAGKKIATIDLYDALINGNLNFNRLRSGDSIIVDSVMPAVSISGGIANPAKYELAGDENLQSVIDLAGGILPGYSLQLSVHRQSGEDGAILPVKLNDASNFALQHGDSIKVSLFNPSSQMQKTVVLSGEVRKPGAYNIIEGETLSELLARAGGYTDNAYEFAGVLLRESAKEMERKINTRIYNDMIKFIATSPLAKNIVSGGNSSLPLILSEFKNVNATGRIAADFDISSLSKNPNRDTILVDGDQIHIPAYTQEIYVLGEVVAPGARLYAANSNVSDYLAESGGLGAYGDKSRIIIIQPDGNATIYAKNIFLKNSSDILPGSVIYVPREIGKLDGINLAAIVAPIFSSLAISLASLNSINSN